MQYENQSILLDIEEWKISTALKTLQIHIFCSIASSSNRCESKQNFSPNDVSLFKEGLHHWNSPVLFSIVQKRQQLFFCNEDYISDFIQSLNNFSFILHSPLCANVWSFWILIFFLDHPGSNTAYILRHTLYRIGNKTYIPHTELFRKFYAYWNPDMTTFVVTPK